MKLNHMIATLAVAASVGAFTFAGADDASARKAGGSVIEYLPVPVEKCWWTCPR